MITVTSTEINAKPEQVWSWIWDEDKIEQWVENLVGAETIEQVPGEVGSTFKNTFSENGKEFVMEGVVNSYNEYTDYEISLTGSMFDLTIGYVLEDLGSSVRATQTSNITKLKGFFKLMAPLFWFMKSKACKDQIKMMERMKELCEGESNTAETGESPAEEF